MLEVSVPRSSYCDPVHMQVVVVVATFLLLLTLFPSSGQAFLRPRWGRSKGWSQIKLLGYRDIWRGGGFGGVIHCTLDRRFVCSRLGCCYSCSASCYIPTSAAREWPWLTLEGIPPWGGCRGGCRCCCCCSHEPIVVNGLWRGLKPFSPISGKFHVHVYMARASLRTTHYYLTLAIEYGRYSETSRNTPSTTREKKLR